VKVGDLIKCKVFGDISLIVEIDHNHHISYGLRREPAPYLVKGARTLEWLTADYIENDCEVISESR